MSFNPRSHEGSDNQRYRKRKQNRLCFNPRSHEGSDNDFIVFDESYIRFNPRSHEGSDVVTHVHRYSRNVSIHAPTRGATMWCCYPTDNAPVSIHAPTRGATEWLEQCFEIVEFQSTLPRGERRKAFGRPEIRI